MKIVIIFSIYTIYMHKRLQQAIGVDTTDDKLKLLQAPKKDKDVGSHQVLTANAVCQTDITYWPSDHGYKYLLTIVDNVDRSIDAEPLKAKDSVAIKNG